MHPASKDNDVRLMSIPTHQTALLVCCYRCSLMCSQKVAIVHKGKCGTCAPNQLPGGFPFCAAGDRTGVSPVCGKNGVTYRNSIAAGAASVEAASTGTCPGSQCGQEVRLLSQRVLTWVRCGSIHTACSVHTWCRDVRMVFQMGALGLQLLATQHRITKCGRRGKLHILIC